ncbi:hypothetical protein PUW24_16185 [Paenibacillus urinalis]|uniref:Uncharacterized protein n=1 Tax=Paenibacillus urinalis TaxID=521520 RepID=A0ABY7XDR3_9BACL|nr:hypothetical protein [Paenibacillus urinalis]WDH95740.1 hypothetical protein PUW24_16185 [Paenibacillus urinalis]WDI03936.1 hypothetical protein PUW25_08300 [Paenibacillus urinalis]
MEMKPVEWITTILAFVAIIVSVFSWWIARRNTQAAERNALAAERSAVAAIQSNEHTKRQYEAFQVKERQRRDSFRRLYIKRLVKSARQIHSAVLGKYQVDSPFARNPVVIDWESIRNVPQEVIFTDDILIDIFTHKEREQIERAWSSLNHLIDEYGIEDAERTGIGYAGQVIGDFHRLIQMFENG